MTGTAVLGNYTTPQVVLAGTKPNYYHNTRTPKTSLQCFSLSAMLRFWNAIWYIKVRKRNGSVQTCWGYGHVNDINVKQPKKVQMFSELHAFHWIIVVLIGDTVVCIFFQCELWNRIDCLKSRWFCFFTGKVNSDKVWKSSFIRLKHVMLFLIRYNF